MKLLLLILLLILTVSLAQATKVCPNCGQEYPDDWNYCDKCVVNGKGVLLVAKGGGKTKTVGPGIKLVRVPGGTFQMGSNEGDADEKPVHPVTVSSFYMGETEVTIGQYVAFLNEMKPSSSQLQQWISLDQDAHITQSGNSYYADSGWDDNPVVNVSWYGAKAFCEQYGLRLPTEAEWEYAAGGPQHFKWSLGNEFDGKSYCYAGYQGSGSPATKKVKSFSANGYGLYEMSGNVWEWCSDWYGDYQSDSQRNPQGSTSGQYRVLRGGSWLHGATGLRCASRGYHAPAYQSLIFGCRVSGD